MSATLWHILIMLVFVFFCGCFALGLLKACDLLDAELRRLRRDREVIR